MYSLKDKAEAFTQLSNHDCINAYKDPRKASSELILVSTVATEQNVGNGTASSWVDGWYNNYHLGRWDFSNWWSCQGLQQGVNSCPEDWAERSADSWKVYNRTIQYCLVGESGDNDSKRGLHFSRAIFISVAINVLIGAGLMWWVVHLSKTPTLVTLGDAQASFLAKRDTHTLPAPVKPLSKKKFARLGEAEWRPVRLFWSNAVGSTMWMITRSKSFAKERSRK
ncbi:hypothetical protein NX059_005982 [Plenodomus lindquistii]|nr:hypothetical protein NX059_005982 [Plenodomus lindquistii]